MGVLPVFSFEEEAKTFLKEAGKFLRLEALRSGWRIRETSTGELISRLFDPCARYERVALDPLAEISAEMAMDLVSMGREEFVQSVLVGTTWAKEHKEVGDERGPD